MATQTQTVKQYLKNKKQSIAVPTVAETKTRRMEGLFDRMEHALWRISFLGGFSSPASLSGAQQLEFQYSSALTPREKARIDADLRGL